MRRCGATSRPRMSATPRRSCSPTWRQQLPERSCTSTRASATSSPGSALLLLQINRVDGDARAALEARDVGLVVGGALHAGGARFELLVAGHRRLAFDHLGDAH